MKSLYVNKTFVLTSVFRPPLAASQSQNSPVAQLRLRFCAVKQMPLGRSIVTAKSVSKYGVIPEKLIYGQTLKINKEYSDNQTSR